jgi:glycosyltransferase involved in cell wall biosynthesis
MELVPISGRHVRPQVRDGGDARWPWLSAPYFLCPANVFWHKNHEALLEGYAKSGVAWPLVLTGPGTDLVDTTPRLRKGLRRVAVAVGLRPPHRAGMLRDRARQLGLDIGRNLIALGNLDDGDYDVVLRRAACVVMPTLGEGGGSFPVEEALLCGVPVVCSDIPVLREQVARLGAEVTWFDPLRPEQLASGLKALAADYPRRRDRAMAQVGRLHPRTWDAVAADYLAVFRAVAAVPR